MPYGRRVPWYACLAIIAVVYTVSRVRSKALKAFVYSLPIPITLVMATTHPVVSADNLIGVASLVLFFFVVDFVRPRVRGNMFVAVALAVAVYLGVAYVVAVLPTAPFVPTAVIITLLWAVNAGVAVARGTSPAASGEAPAPTSVRRELFKLSTLTAGTFVLAFLARFLGALAVTFPYSGLLVALDLGAESRAFARQFALGSIALVAFFVAFWSVQSSLAFAASLAIGWAAFLAASGLVALLRRAARSRSAPLRLPTRTP